MVAVLLAVGGLSLSAGVGWHDQYPGRDPVFGFRLHLGARAFEADPIGLGFIVVAQGASTRMENDDQEFPAEWSRFFGLLAVGLQLDHAPFALQVAVDPALSLNTHQYGGNDDGAA